MTSCIAVRLDAAGWSLTILRDRATLPDQGDFLTAGHDRWFVPASEGEFTLRMDEVEGSSRITLVEQATYRFYVSGSTAAPAALQVGETPLTPSHVFGEKAAFSWNTGNAIGWLRIRATLAGEPPIDLGRVWIGPRKLTADADFEWLVDDIARTVRALAFDLAGATTLPWARTAEPPSFDYEDLVFLRSVIADVELAVRRINRRPHEKVSKLTPWRDVSLGGDLDTSRATDVISRPDALAQASLRGAHWLRPELASQLKAMSGKQLTISRIPVVERIRNRDTYENRFVRFVLDTFRRRADAIADHARSRSRAGLASDADEVATRCAVLLRLPFLEGVGTLNAMQATSQVLLREDAYFRVLRAYLEFLLAADVLWVQDELKRIQEIHDVATLYEMWVFMEAVKSVVRVTDGKVVNPGDTEPAVRVDDKGLVVQLKRGAESGMAVRDEHGTTTVYYNRSFGTTSSSDWRSWSLPLRPDVTIERTVAGRRTVVVLDAK